MATWLEMVDSVEKLLGNRTDVRDTVIIAVQDAVTLIKAETAKPNSKNFIETILVFDEEVYPVSVALPDNVQSVGGCTYYTGETPSDDGRWVPVEDGHPRVFLQYSRTGPPTRYHFNKGRLLIWPVPDRETYYLRLFINEQPPLYSADEEIPIDPAMLPAVRMHALSIAKIIVHGPDAAQGLSSIATKFSKRSLTAKARTEESNRQGFKMVYE